VSEPFQPAAFRAIREAPRFREAVEMLARGNGRQYAGLTDAQRWMIKDLYLASLTVAALILDSLDEGVTPARLTEAALTNRTCSAGQTRNFIERAQAYGLLSIPAGEEAWTRRRMALHPALTEPLREMTRLTLLAATMVSPEIEVVSGALEQPGGFRNFYAWSGMLTASRPDLFAGPDLPILLFLGRDGGKRILDDLMCSQPAVRTRLLDAAPLSRTALARRFGVSRTQVARLLADAETRGLLACDGATVRFSNLFSEDVERHYALVFELTRGAAMAAPRVSSNTSA